MKGLKFNGSGASDTSHHNIECYANIDGEVFICLSNVVTGKGVIVLDKDTAINFSSILINAINKIKCKELENTFT